MKTKDHYFTALRVALGLFLILYALNKFLHVVPASFGAMPESTQDFLDATAAYLPALYIFEIILGLFLLLNKWTPFVLIVLAPLSLGFLIFSVSNANVVLALPAVVVAGINLLMMLRIKDKYSGLFS